MNERSPLDDIECYLDALEAGLGTVEPESLEIPAPQLDEDAQIIDGARARELMERLSGLQLRTEGQRVRVAGEIAGLRRRPGNDGHRRSPSSFDRSL